MPKGTSKPKPRPRPTKPKGGYRFPSLASFAALAGTLVLATACGLTSTKPTPDEVLAEVERHACYSRAGLAAEAALKEKCPVPADADAAAKAFTLATCSSIEALLEELESQLEKCDG